MNRPALFKATALPLTALFATLLASCGQDDTGCTDTGETSVPADETLAIDQDTLDGYLDADGALTEEACFQLCMENVGAFDVEEWTECRDDGMADDGTQTIFCSWTEIAYCVGGRDSACIQSESDGIGPDPVSAWAAGTAHAEAASVAAFLELRRELLDHGAPRSLVDAALDAARDEVAHARAMARLAGARGGKVRQLRFERIDSRALEAIAIENAIEGCVRETWAALLACHQARHARDPEVRAAMIRIAEDETRHAELAREIDAWVAKRLDDPARRRVASAKRRAVRELVDQLRGPSEALREQAGLPSLDVARRLAHGLRETVWAA